MKKTLSITLTLVTVVIAIVVLLLLFRNYWAHPWTRDGQVQAYVVQITPRVSGPIIELHVVDNQIVKTGDLLFKIDPRTFEETVHQKQAALDQAVALSAESTVEAQRIQNIYRRDQKAVSLRKVTSTGHAKEAAIAAVEEAKAELRSAKLDLEFTEVRAPLDGYITNSNLQIGEQTVANQPIVALVNRDSFYIYGFFKETQIKNIQKGQSAVVKLMAYRDEPLEGTVDSLGWGIARSDGSTGIDLLMDIDPSFDWIRLAQRIPVTIKLTDVPESVKLRVGMTASVFIKD